MRQQIRIKFFLPAIVLLLKQRGNLPGHDHLRFAGQIPQVMQQHRTHIGRIDAGNFSTNGYNVNNPAYTQFFKTTQIPQPSNIFVFLDEHPDSINDGYFLNKAPQSYYGSSRYGVQWTDLPASYHNAATAFSYADGHAALHRWTQSGTVRPSVPNGANLPIPIQSGSVFELADFDWVIHHMSIGN